MSEAAVGRLLQPCKPTSASALWGRVFMRPVARKIALPLGQNPVLHHHSHMAAPRQPVYPVMAAIAGHRNPGAGESSAGWVCWTNLFFNTEVADLCIWLDGTAISAPLMPGRGLITPWAALHPFGRRALHLLHYPQPLHLFRQASPLAGSGCIFLDSLRPGFSPTKLRLGSKTHSRQAVFWLGLQDAWQGRLAGKMNEFWRSSSSHRRRLARFNQRFKGKPDSRAMNILYHLTILPPKLPAAEALSQEISALRGRFGGELVYLNPNQRSPIYLPRLLFGFQRKRATAGRRKPF
ncbi:MAG: hypothetical protein U0401_33095 [Anaerolineae bacterium]